MTETPERRLSAVWFADIVGYTSMTSSDEAGALELVELLQEVAGDAVASRGGRIVKFLGDAVMAEFVSAEAAVDAALDLTERFGGVARDAERPASLRIGAHLGELTRSPDGDIYGDVVNTAARLQGEADPGQVLVSEDVWRQLRRRRSFRFEERGARTLKGKDEPVQTFDVARRYPRRPRGSVHGASPDETEAVAAAREEGRRRIVVLPFRVLRADPEVDFLAFGLADAVSSSLMGFDSLIVRSAPRLDAEQSRVDPREVARAARVDLVLSGTVQRAGDQVRVTARLAEGEHGTFLWNQTSTRTLGDLFELQDELTRRIVDSLAEPLTAEEREKVSRDVPGSGNAYELYLRANQAAVAARAWSRGVELYRAALEEDPNFAPAWARLGRCYRLLAKYGGDPERAAEQRRSAEEAFRRALELNPDLALGHSLYAQFEVEAGRPLEGLVRLLRRAARHPSEVHLFVGLTHASRYCGLSEASVAAHERARELDPDVRTSVAYTYLQMADGEAALATAPSGDPSVIYALHSLGRVDEARAAYEAEGTDAESGIYDAFARTVFAADEGDREAALRHGRRAAADFPDPEGRYFIARCWAEVGARQEALDVLESVVDDGFHCVDGLDRDPMLSSLRDAPAFGALLERAESARDTAREAFAEELGAEVLWPQGGGEGDAAAEAIR